MNRTQLAIWFLRAAALLLLASFAFAQTTTLALTGPATARPDSTITVLLNGTMAGSPAGVQWEITLPAGWTNTATAGAAATAASKTLYCNSVGVFCLVAGMNTNVIANGVLATNTIRIPAGAAPAAYPIPLSRLAAATAQGALLTVNSGPPYSVTVLALSDLNGDGRTDVADLALLVNQLLGVSACSNDQNNDGKCDLVDAMLLIKAGLGL